MRVILDTHTFLWCLLDSAEVSTRARDIFTDRDNAILLSTVSLWEMAIKSSLGKLKVSRPLRDWLPAEIEKNGLTLVPPTLQHVLHVEQLPFYHRDPFDRLLAAQCLCEGVPLLGRDRLFDAYGVERLW